MDITFLGAAGTVTGSHFLVRHERTSLLIDCGLFQGLKELRKRNWERPPFDPRKLDGVVLTHAHLDHSGNLPRLIKQGYSGKVHCTAATASLANLLLPDSGHLQEEDARYANKRGFSKHAPAEPLYTEADAVAAVQHLSPVGWKDTIEIGGLRVTFHRAGHILGAASVRIEGPSGAVLFSGDLGRTDDLLMPAPDAPAPADWVVMESTYGDRRHPGVHPLEQLAQAVTKTLARGGAVLIPSFAVGRAQAVLYGLHQLKEQGRIPSSVPIYLNSPMAIDTTELYLRHHVEHRLSEAETRAMCAAATLVRTEEESRALNESRRPAIIISASGMLTGGRVLHHLRALAPDPKNTLLFVGYQAVGTRGAAIVAGADRVKVHGEWVPIRCEVDRIDAWSAHADQQGLVDWISAAAQPARHVFLVHGEPAASDALRLRLKDQGLSVSVPAMGDRFPLPGAPVAVPAAPRPSIPAAWQDLDEGARQTALESAPAFQRASEDLAFLDRDELRPFRLGLEYLKVDLALREASISEWIAVIGGARIQDPELAAAVAAQAALNAAAAPDDPAAERALEVAKRAEALSRWYREAAVFSERAVTRGKLPIATGGGGGVAEAANRGAFDQGVPSAGLCVTEPNPYVAPALCFRFRYPAVRSMHLLQHARAVVAFPGGLGTLEQLAGTLVRIQDGTLPAIPIVLVGRKHWHEAFPGEAMVRLGTAPEGVLDTVHYVDTGLEAWELLERELANGLRSR